MPTRKEHRKKNHDQKKANVLLILLLIAMLAVIISSALNIYNVRSSATADDDTIKSDTISNKYINDYYSIGNNATDINKKYFLELNDAVAANDPQLIAQDVVKCFITEYYTWTNKDGNYDVGGMQYIFTDRQSDFSTYSRDNFYSEMDNYLAQNDRSSLMQVKDVTITSCTETPAVTVLDASGNQVSYSGYSVSASWTYEDGSVVDTSALQSAAVFTVVNHNGRMEIAAIQ